MLKFFRIYKKAISFSISQATIFRTSFLLFFLWIFFDTLIKLIFFKALFVQVPSIGGWTYYDCLMLVVFQGMMYDFAWMTFITAFEKFVGNFTEGNFDFILTKPMHPLTYLTVTGFSAKSCSGARVPILIYSILFFPFAWHFGNTFLLVIIFSAGLVAMHGIFALISSLLFWTTEGASAFDLIWNIIEAGRLPNSIYPLALRFIFTFLIPIFLISTYPVLALKNDISWTFAIAAILIAFFIQIVAYKTWDFAIKRYSSASS